MPTNPLVARFIATVNARLRAPDPNNPDAVTIPRDEVIAARDMLRRLQDGRVKGGYNAKGKSGRPVKYLLDPKRKKDRDRKRAKYAEQKEAQNKSP